MNTQPPVVPEMTKRKLAWMTELMDILARDDAIREAWQRFQSQVDIQKDRLLTVSELVQGL